MSLGIYIAVLVLAIVAVVMVKLIRSTSKTSAFSMQSRCTTCGHKKGFLKCPFCHPSTNDRPPEW